jgi:alpha-D-ribose 1-methylphosphonate 5-triphosphate synthase subunit PhnL
MPLLTVDGLAKHFNIHHLGRRIEVFEQLSFALHTGEFLLVTGPNGAGKSTLLRCLYRTYRPTGGQAQFAAQQGRIDLATAADIDIALLRKHEIGFVTQFLRARPRVTAVELVAEPLLATGVALAGAEERAKAALNAFGLKPALWNAYPTTFSGGEQQKVNLARALIHPYRLLLLDEPTASLDANARRALVQRLAELKAQGVAMIAVLHHAEDAAALIDRELPITQVAVAEDRLWNEEEVYVDQ